MEVDPRMLGREMDPRLMAMRDRSPNLTLNLDLPPSRPRMEFVANVQVCSYCKRTIAGDAAPGETPRGCCHCLSNTPPGQLSGWKFPSPLASNPPTLWSEAAAAAGNWQHAQQQRWESEGSGNSQHSPQWTPASSPGHTPGQTPSHTPSQTPRLPASPGRQSPWQQSDMQNAGPPLPQLPTYYSRMMNAIRSSPVDDQPPNLARNGMSSSMSNRGIGLSLGPPSSHGSGMPTAPGPGLSVFSSHSMFASGGPECFNPLWDSRPRIPNMSLAPPNNPPSSYWDQPQSQFRPNGPPPAEPPRRYFVDFLTGQPVAPPGTLLSSARRNLLRRYSLKRANRSTAKKIKYECRKLLANNRPRIKGRFATPDEIIALGLEKASASRNSGAHDEGS